MRTFWPLALAAALPASLGACSSSSSNSKQPRDVTITWSNVKQTIDGFGASSAFFGGNITDAQADELFDAKKGLGLSLLRTMIGVPDDTQSDGSEPTTGANPLPTAPELTTAQQAIARGCRVWATAWTPPPIWKTTNNKDGSGDGYTSNKLQPAHYQDYADYLANFVDLMAAANVPLLGVSPANEPDYTATWDGAQWTAAELTTFISQYMGPTFTRRWPNVKLIAPDTANFPSLEKYVPTLLADPNANDAISIIATHPYSTPTASDLSYNTPQKSGKRFWETEWSQENPKGDTPDPTMTSAINMAEYIHDNMVTTGMNAWSWWAIYITKDGLNDPLRMNPAFMQPALQPDGTLGDPYMFKRGYAFGNWSKFVRPGFQRIDATDKPTPNVLIEAYRDATHLAVIAVNTGATTVTQTFHLAGGSFGTLTPWVTSADDSLAAQSPITADDSFSFDLPPSSVVTFVNWDATTETPGQGENSSDRDGGVDAASKPLNGLDCTNPVVPDNVVSGGVTDFTDWKGSTGVWGDPQGLHGNIYSYQGPKGSTMSATVDTAADDLHVTGSVVAGDYGGAGLSFSVCASVSTFSQIQFTLAGSAPGCNMELQMKTFDQQPVSQTPAGGCSPDASGGCYNFPVVKQIAVPSATPMTVVAPLANFSSWSTENANQVVGMQWQFTGAALAPDAGAPDGGAGCPIDVTITGIKFLP